MESNIKGLVAAGHEMASELKAECGAVDMRSVAKLISDLATQLEVQLVRANALAEDHQRAIESIKQADSAVKLAHEKFSALAAENQPVRGNQAAESNRGNEWTGNPDIDNAIIMLDRIDTLESCDDDRIEAVKTVLRRLAGNYPVTPDGWISCSERMPAQDDWILIYSKHGEYMAGQVQGEYVELSDGTLSWLGNALYWMPLPEPPQEVN